MSRLEDAQQRLDTVLSKLDAAIDRRLSEPEGGAPESLMAEKTHLETTRDAVASQLDRTIERLRRLLRD